MPRGRGKLQPKAEFAADSLQIAQMVIFNAILDCSLHTISDAAGFLNPSAGHRRG
jgi:hypothetical protein